MNHSHTVDEEAIRNTVEVSLDLPSATVVLEALLKISSRSLFDFPLRDILNLDCWLSLLPAPELDATGVRVDGSDRTAAVTDLMLTLSDLKLNVTCIACSSPEIEEMSRLLSDPSTSDDVTQVANDLLGYVTELLGGTFLQVQIDRFLNEAPKRCPHRPEYQDNFAASSYAPFEAVDTETGSVTFLIALGAAAATMLLVVLAIIFFVRCTTRRRNRAWVLSLSDRTVVQLHKAQMEQLARDKEINGLTVAMFRSKHVPWLARYFVPLIILGNVGFFLSGHLSLGATVNIEARFAGQELTIDKFFEFSMAKSSVDIWNAGGRELTIMILIFSGIWPYTKQFITLFLWFAPPRTVSVQRRGSIFLWLDALAKWSMVDIFVLVVSVAAFRVSIVSPVVSFLPEDFYSIDLLVVPLWGLYANMIAQIISQVSSHFIIHYHRKIVTAAEGEYEQLHQQGIAPAATIDGMTSKMGLDDVGIQATVYDGTKKVDDSVGGDGHGHGSDEDGVAFEVFDTHSNHRHDDDDDDINEHQHRYGPTDGVATVLKNHMFRRPHRESEAPLRARRFVQPAMLFVAVFMSFLVILGCVLPSLSLEVLGVIGVAVETGQNFNDARVEHSVFSIVQLLVDVASFLGSARDAIGLGVLGMLYLLTVLVVPTVQVLLLLRQWFRPLSPTQRRKLSITIETVQAWQYIEVYLIAIIVSSWQLGPVSDFMINSYCDSLDGVFASLVYYGLLETEDAQCFQVEANVEMATYILILAAILLALLNTFIKRAVEQYERDALSRSVPKTMGSAAAAGGGGGGGGTGNDDDENDVLGGDKEEVEIAFDVADRARRELDAPPVMFTDTFRWMLQPDTFLNNRDGGAASPGVAVNSTRGIATASDGKLGVTDGFVGAARSLVLGRMPNSPGNKSNGKERVEIDEGQIVNTNVDYMLDNLVDSNSDSSIYVRSDELSSDNNSRQSDARSLPVDPLEAPSI